MAKCCFFISPPRKTRGALLEHQAVCAGGCWEPRVGRWVLGGRWVLHCTHGGVPVGQPRQALAADNAPLQIKARAPRARGEGSKRLQVRAWPIARFPLLWRSTRVCTVGGQGCVRRVRPGSALPLTCTAASLTLLGAPVPRTAGAQRGCGSATLLLSPGAFPQGLAQHFRLDPGLPLPAAPRWVLSDVHWVQPPALDSL